METIPYEILAQAVGGTAVGFRSISRLEPLGGSGRKLSPATLCESVRLPTPVGVDREHRRRTRYALEWRRVTGASNLCVALDSVASQANRMELMLLDGHDRGELAFPSARVVALEAPHRLANAHPRDSRLEARPFRSSDTGRRCIEASRSR